jgi:hypothetical protein
MTFFLIAVFFLLLLTLPVVSGVIAYHAVSHFQKKKIRDQRISKDLIYVMTLNHRGPR